MSNLQIWGLGSMAVVISRGNAVPIVKIPLESMGTAFPLLNYGENAWERCCIVTKLK